MKKITCIQQYVIDNLIEDEILSTNSLLSAVSKVCSEEQFNNILSILIETPIPCTDIPKLERGAYIQTMYDNSCKCYYII